MGLIGSKQDDQLQQAIKQEYQTQSNQYLLHKKQQLPCTLHKITTTSAYEASSVYKNIQQYRTSPCRSISKLKQYYQIDNSGYCSDQQNFYLIFEGQNIPTVREQYLARRYKSQFFSSTEIENILAVMLCGLHQYSKKFGRRDSKISLQTVGINTFNRNQIYLKDPWLSARIGQTGQHSLNFITSYPSPEKLQAANSFSSGYDEFKSDLFTVGMIGLELVSMNFKDDMYVMKKYIDRNKIMEQLNAIKESKLRSGVEILLNENPNERENIYNFWNIRCENQYYLPYRQTNEEKPVQYTEPMERKKANYQMKTSFIDRSKHNSQQMGTINITNRPDPNQQMKKIQQIQQVQQVQANLPPIPTQSKVHHQTYHEAKSGRNFSSQSNNRVPSLQMKKTNVGYINQAVKTDRPPVQNAQKQYPLNFDYRNPTIKIESKKMMSENRNRSQKFEHPLVGNLNLNNSLKSNSDSSFQVKRSFQTVSINKQKDSFPKQKQIVHNKTEELLLPKQSERMRQPSFETISNQQQSREEKKLSITHDESTKRISNEQLRIGEEKKTLDEMCENMNVSPSPPTSSLEVTPPARNQNNFNSTIVEVNEETPNSSERSENGLPQHVEFIIEEYETGSRYEGYKKNGVRCGKGKFYYQDGGYYDGEWKNNQMHGWGKLYYEGGKLAYEGNWANDEFHGYGKVYNDNPLPVPGSLGFDYTNFDLLDDYWQYYEGMLVTDTKEGRGRIKLTNGQAFEGDFHNDRIQGFGKFTRSDKSVIEGIWRESRLIKILNSGG